MIVPVPAQDRRDAARRAGHRSWKSWPAPWSWYMYLGTCSARAAAPDLQAAEAELAAAARADGVVANRRLWCGVSPRAMLQL